MGQEVDSCVQSPGGAEACDGTLMTLLAQKSNPEIAVP
jgi:hypothetical protein